MVKGPSLTVFLFNSEALIATPSLVREHFFSHCNSPVLLCSQTHYSSTEINNISVMWFGLDEPLMIILLTVFCVAPLTIWSFIVVGSVDSLPVISRCSYIVFNLSLVFCSSRVSSTFLELSEILVAALAACTTDRELTSVLFSWVHHQAKLLLIWNLSLQIQKFQTNLCSVPSCCASEYIALQSSDCWDTYKRLHFFTKNLKFMLR